MSDTSTNPYDQPSEHVPFSPEEPAKSSRGCLFYGCIIAIVFLILGVILMVIAGYVAYSWSNRMVNTYTSNAPVALPPVNVPEEERKELVSRWETFKKSVEKGEAAELTLTGDQINALLEQEPTLKGKVHVTINGDKISAQLSVPVDFLPFGMGKGRFFNGSATLTVSLHQGELIVHAREFEANGKAPPEDFMRKFSGENLAKEWTKNPQNAEMVSHFDSIEIKDGKIHLKARDKSAPAASDDETKPKDADAKDLPKVDPDAPRAKDDEPKVDQPKGDDAPAPVPAFEEKKAA